MTLSLAPALPVRDRIEQLAEQTLKGHVPDEHLPRHLAELTDLDEDTALDWFLDLCEGVAALGLPWWESIPDATGIERDEQATDAANTRISLALDALTGGAR